MSKQEANGGMAPSKKRKTDRRWPIVAAVVAVVVAVAGGGFWVWHEQPSFCNAICHTPMDPYVAAFDQQPGTAGVDKWGNEVSNTSSMLAVVHAASKDEGGANANCLSCHKPTIAQQLTEVSEWSTGNMPLFANEAYGLVLGERDTEQLGEWLGQEGDAFCLNEACHNITRQDLVKKTARFGERNPHMAMHGQQRDCGDCHKAHRASVMYCTQCHSEAEVPEGWLTVAEANKLSAA